LDGRGDLPAGRGRAGDRPRRGRSCGRKDRRRPLSPGLSTSPGNEHPCCALLPAADSLDGARVGRTQEVFDARGLFALADRTGGTAEGVERAKETAVDLMRVRDRAGSAPAGGAQGVEPTVVADTSVGIGIDEATLLVRFIGEFRPRQGGSGQCGGDVDGLFTGIDALAGLDIRVVVGQVSRLRAELCRIEVSDVRWIADGL